jgi:hypothetical protein
VQRNEDTSESYIKSNKIELLKTQTQNKKFGMNKSLQYMRNRSRTEHKMASHHEVG